jgi:thiosulfate/3-mercaptopyruvate sulfurtransferase
MTRYVVIGAGAVGAVTAAGLHEAGREVVLVARGRHLELMRERGLDLIRPEGTRRVAVPVAAGPDEVELAPGDVIVLATKSQDTEAALAQWSWLPVAGTTASAAELLPILLLQNGLENVRTALRRFATVIDASVLIGASFAHPGEVVSPSAPAIGAIFLGRAPTGSGELEEQVADDLRAGGWLVAVVDNIGSLKAGKLVGNISHNADALFAPGPLRDVAAGALAAEARAVLTASGLEIAEPRSGLLDLSAMAMKPIEGHARGGSSTWQSLARTGSHEADFLNGEIVLLARLHGIAAPLNAAFQARLARAAREGTPPGSLGAAELLEVLPQLADRRADVLIDAASLHDELAGGSPPALLDVRWALGDPLGRQHFEDGHIPGAVYVDLDTELAEPPTPLAGRHPLPELDRLQAAARRWGLTAGRLVVVYDNIGGMSAARAWWLLRWAGVREVRILDGALPAWTAAGFELAVGETHVPAGDITLTSGKMPVLSADEAAELAHRGVLIDARAGERYRGEVEPIDPRAGHIPGAVSAPTGDNLDADGHFRPREQLAGQFGEVGAAPGASVGVYCGSGVTASHEIAALATVGVDAALFPGSWSAWSSDPARPVSTGPLPG